jgi:hypothetical protein
LSAAKGQYHDSVDSLVILLKWRVDEEFVSCCGEFDEFGVIL